MKNKKLIRALFCGIIACLILTMCVVPSFAEDNVEMFEYTSPLVFTIAGTGEAFNPIITSSNPDHQFLHSSYDFIRETDSRDYMFRIEGSGFLTEFLKTCIPQIILNWGYEVTIDYSYNVIYNYGVFEKDNNGVILSVESYPRSESISKTITLTENGTIHAPLIDVNDIRKGTDPFNAMNVGTYCFITNYSALITIRRNQMDLDLLPFEVSYYNTDPSFVSSEYTSLLNGFYKVGFDNGRADYIINDAPLDFKEGYEEGLNNSLANLDATSWIARAVSGFLDFELFPNFSLGILLTIIVGISLTLMFLKFFAGG